MYHANDLRLADFREGGLINYGDFDSEQLIYNNDRTGYESDLRRTTGNCYDVVFHVGISHVPERYSGAAFEVDF